MTLEHLFVISVSPSDKEKAGGEDVYRSISVYFSADLMRDTNTCFTRLTLSNEKREGLSAVFFEFGAEVRSHAP